MYGGNTMYVSEHAQNSDTRRTVSSTNSFILFTYSPHTSSEAEEAVREAPGGLKRPHSQLEEPTVTRRYAELWVSLKCSTWTSDSAFRRPRTRLRLTI